MNSSLNSLVISSFCAGTLFSVLIDFTLAGNVILQIYAVLTLGVITAHAHSDYKELK